MLALALLLLLLPPAVRPLTDACTMLPLLLLLLPPAVRPLTDACTMLPFDQYDDLSCNVEGWYNDTRLPCNTYLAADEEDASFLYVPTGLTVTVSCPTRTLLVGSSTFKCTEDGLEPPIKATNTTLVELDPHPACLDVDDMTGAICEASELPLAHPRYKLYSDVDFVFVNQDYRVECEAGYSPQAAEDDIIYGSCSGQGVWEVSGSPCLGMCDPEVRYGGEEQNTAVDYANYQEIDVTGQLGPDLEAVGAVVNMSISCVEGYSPTASDSGAFQLTCTVSNASVTAGFYTHSRKEALVNCARDCTVPAITEGRLIDPWLGTTLEQGTRTMRNSEDSARMRCPTGSYSLGRVEIKCHEGNITHTLPTCTREFQPCEAPTVEWGERDPYNRAPGDTYTLACLPGYALTVLSTQIVTCRSIPGRLTDLMVPAAELSPASTFSCHEGCHLPFSSIAHGTLQPEANLTGAPYKRGETITVTCFGGPASQHTCLFDGWDREDWKECVVYLSGAGTSMRACITLAVLMLAAVF